MRFFLLFSLVVLITACGPKTDKIADKPTAIPQEISFDAAKHLQSAQELFAYQDGFWDSKWDWVDKDGKFLVSVTGTETFITILDGSVQELLNDVPDMGGKSKAVMTYNHEQGKIIFFSMGPKGDYWLMKQNPVTGAMVSEPHRNADGRTQIIRFTTVRKTNNEMDIVMERSMDDGASWTKVFTQYMVRRTAE